MPAASEARAEPFDEIWVPDVRGEGRVDPRRSDVEDSLRPRGPRPARRLGDERDRVRLEVEPVLARGLVDLRGVREEAAVMEDLVEVADEGTAVAEGHKLPFELADEPFHLRVPLT